MRQHRLDDAVGAPPMPDNLVEVASQYREGLVDLGTLAVVERGKARRGRRLQLVEKLDREPSEIVDEVERILDLVRNAGGQLPERRLLLRVNEARLRGAQLAQGRFRRVACR